MEYYINAAQTYQISWELQMKIALQVIGAAAEWGVLMDILWIWSGLNFCLIAMQMSVQKRVHICMCVC